MTNAPLTWTATAFTRLAARAAAAAGFPDGNAQAFGKAAAHHVAAGGPHDALLRALDDPSDSPILRLPLLMNDVLRATRATGIGTRVRLSLRPEDRALAPAYAQTLAVRLETVEIIEGTGDAPARFVATVTEDAAQPICGLPDLALSETLAEGLMARQPAVEETD